MKWDIDRALRFFRSEVQAHVRIGNEVINATRLPEIRLKARDDSGSAEVWFLTFGMEFGQQRTFYGFTIHDACLRATKFLKKASPQELAQLSILQKPKKPGGYVRGKFKKARGVED